MQRTVMFAGPLADRFTHESFRLDCDDLLTLMSGLEANFPGFKSELHSYRDVAFLKVKDDKAASLTEEMFPMNFGSADTLVVSAAEDGSAMAAATWVFEALATYGSTIAAVAAVVTYVAVSVAIAYAAGAVMKSLSKSHDTSGSTKAQNASALYNGPQNVVEQGGAIPLIYGRHRVGGTIISSEISTDRLPSLSPDTFTLYAGGTFNANVTSNDVLREYLAIASWTVDSAGTYAAGASYTSGTGATSLSLSIASDGTLTLTTGVSASGTVKGTYTATDANTGTALTTAFSIVINPTVIAWSNNDPTWSPEIA